MPRPHPYLLLLPVFVLLPAVHLHHHPAQWKARLSSPPPPPLQAPIITGLSHIPPHPTPPHTPTPTPTPRVAVCITGHLRTLLHRPVHTSIRRYFLSPLPSPTIFLHLGLHDAPRANRSAAAALPTPAALSALRAHFPTARISFFSTTSPPLRAQPCSNATRRRPTSAPPALRRARDCLRLVQRHESRTGVRFDWVYKTRPDVAFGRPVPAPGVLRNDTAYVNVHNPGTSVHAHAWLRARFAKRAKLHQPVGDHVLVAARAVAGYVLRADEAFDECALYQLPSGAVNSEVGLTYWLAKGGVRYEVSKWFWMLVRQDRVECERVRWIGREETERCEEFASTGVLG